MVFQIGWEEHLGIAVRFGPMEVSQSGFFLSLSMLCLIKPMNISDLSMDDLEGIAGQYGINL